MRRVRSFFADRALQSHEVIGNNTSATYVKLLPGKGHRALLNRKKRKKYPRKGVVLGNDNFADGSTSQSLSDLTHERVCTLCESVISGELFAIMSEYLCIHSYLCIHHDSLLRNKLHVDYYFMHLMSNIGFLCSVSAR